jgi:hypothetical protein
LANTVPTIIWTGFSARDYTYYIYRLPCVFDPQPGNYVFAKQTAPGQWRPIYIGETGDLSERFEHHHKMPCIEAHGATHIHVHLEASRQARRDEEMDLLRVWAAVCNG